jgi:hypothetical protein
MDKTQRHALPLPGMNDASNSRLRFSRVNRTPLAIVGSPSVARIPDIENHIVRIAGLGEQAF